VYIRCDEFSEKAIVTTQSLIILIKSKQTFLRHHFPRPQVIT